MIERLSRSDDQTVRVDRDDLDEFIADAFEACNVLADAAGSVANGNTYEQIETLHAAWERLSKWCSE